MSVEDIFSSKGRVKVLKVLAERGEMNISEIQGAPSGDFYQGIGNMAGVDITTSSAGFKVVNTRGFNSTSPVRSVTTIHRIVRMVSAQARTCRPPAPLSGSGSSNGSGMYSSTAI
mgnify:CR=1 FL=1